MSIIKLNFKRRRSAIHKKSDVLFNMGIRKIKIEFHFTGIFIIYCSLNTLGNLRQQEVTQKDEWNHGLRLLLIFWHYVLLCIIMCNFLLNLNLHFFRQ